VVLEYTAADSSAHRRRVATGVVVSDQGEILSVRIDPPPASRAPATKPNLAPIIVAQDSTGRRHVAQWVASDPDTGLTLLRVSAHAVRPIRVAAEEPTLGSPVFVVGNPFGMGHSISRGHIVGLDRALALGTCQLGGLIQVQAPLYPGDSGAAVVDLQGGWLGLIRSGLAIPSSDATNDSESVTVTGPAGAGAQNHPPAPAAAVDSADLAASTLADRSESDTDFGFAIPTRDALWVAEQLRTHGYVDRAYLGVRLEPTVQDGALLCEVVAATPAALAGLRPGDRIVAFDGRTIRSPYDVIDRLDRIPAGATILLSVVRNDDARHRRFDLPVRTAGRYNSPLAVLGPSGLATRSPRASVPVTPTASQSATVGAVLPARTSSSSRDPALPVGADLARAEQRREPVPSDRLRDATTTSTPPQSELQFTLPRAVSERIDQLERRLKKLETFSTPTPNRAVAAGAGRSP
jgi:S1-C subfamily serine protease